MKGDTVFGARDYKKVYSSIDSTFTLSTYEGGIRQDTLNKKVYFRSWDVGCGPEETIADFSLHQGDSSQTYVCAPMFYAVDSVDSVYIDGALKMRQIYGLSLFGMPEYSIEGIGSSFSLIKPHWNFCVADLEYHVTCVHSKTSIVWTNPAFNHCVMSGAQENSTLQKVITISPNPVTGISVIELNQSDCSVFRIYDINGRCVNSFDCKAKPYLYLHAAEYKKGMYFYRAECSGSVESGKFIIE
jgi:hypothetical protein